MDIDIVYKISKDLAFKAIKKRVSRNSIKLAIYKSCPDFYTTKKTIWATVESLRKDGVMAIECFYSNISNIINFCESQGYLYDVLTFVNQNIHGIDFNNFFDSTVKFVLIYKDNVGFAGKKSNIINLGDDIIADISKILFNFTNVKDYIMLIGNEAVLYSFYAKEMCRYIIGFSDDDMILSNIDSEGIKISCQLIE